MAGKTDLRKLEDRVRRLEKTVRDLSLRVESLSSSDLEMAILEILAMEWEAVSPPGILDIAEVAEKLEEPQENIKERIESLFTRGIVDSDRFRVAVYLTDKGYEMARHVVEKKRKDPAPLP